ncbi:hypothetical protein PM082_012722 [Marasmius tenuissimus]|nr:hypothetical protein PM082_012722 [Marasmius tenuissimus]
MGVAPRAGRNSGQFRELHFLSCLSISGCRPTSTLTEAPICPTRCPVSWLVENDSIRTFLDMTAVFKLHALVFTLRFPASSCPPWYNAELPMRDYGGKEDWAGGGGSNATKDYCLRALKNR